MINCYQLIKSHTYHKISHDNIDLWHQKLGHLNFKNLKKIVNTNAIRGIPTLSKKEPDVSGPFQLNKTIEGVTQFIATNKYNKSPRIASYGPHGTNAG